MHCSRTTRPADHNTWSSITLSSTDTMLTCTHCTTGAPRRCHRADHLPNGQLTISSHVTRQAAHRHSLLFPHPSLYLVGGLDFALLISALFCCRVLIFSTSIAAGSFGCSSARPPASLRSSVRTFLFADFLRLSLSLGVEISGWVGFCWRRGSLRLVALCGVFCCSCASGHLVQFLPFIPLLVLLTRGRLLRNGSG